MKQLILQRTSYKSDQTTGSLWLDDEELFTIERPWIPTDPGGKPRESCVPAGKYKLIPHTRPRGDKVVALVNHGLGVYYLDEERPGAGRYLILIHAGNWVKDVVGCIAPGIGKTDNMVTNSRDAMAKIMAYIGDDEAELEIIGDNFY